MALTYRSPIEEVLTLLEPAAQSLISTTATTSYQQNEKENFQWFNYSVTPIAKEHLSNAGIYLSPYSGYPHSHPTCKILENYMLYKVLPSIINNTFYFVGIKQFKLNFLKKRHKNLSLLTAINRYVSSADKIRYGNEFVVRESSESRLLKRHCGVHESATLSTLVPNVKTHANLFLHDELHYWVKDDLITFLEICKPNIMLGTLVFPPEIFIGATTSLNRWCYDFEVRKDKLFFFPDGVRSEGYEQPLNGGYLLQTNQIELPDGTVYCVDVIASKFAHHLVSITRGQLVVPTYRSFGPFEAVHVGAMKDISRGFKECIPISIHTILRVYRYLRSLKKPDKQSAMAKFSQLSHEPSGMAIKFMEEFSNLVINTESIRTMVQPELIKTFFGNLGRKLPGSLAAKISVTRSVCLDEFIGFLKPLCVDLKLKSMSRSTLLDFFPLVCEAEEGVDLVDVYDNNWNGAGLFDREPRPYIGMAPIIDNLEKFRLSLNLDAMLQGLMDLHLKANYSRCTGFTTTLWDYIESLRRNATIIAQAFLHVLSRAAIEKADKWLHVVYVHEVGFHELKHKWFSQRTSRSCMKFLACPTEESYVRQFESNTHIKPPMKGVVLRKFSLEDFDEDLYYNLSNDLSAPSLVQRQSLGPSNPISPQHFSGPTTHAHFQAYSVDELDEDQFYNIEKHQTTPVRVTPQEVKCEALIPAKQAEQNRSLTCKCGINLPICKLKFNEDLPFEFTDQLKGRSGAWYSRGNVDYSYNGGAHKSKGWPQWLALWMKVNSIDEKYDCVLVQQYAANCAIGLHSDDEKIFKKGESICTVNLTGSAQFGISCGVVAWHEVVQGDVFTMPMGFQEDHKHSVRHTTAGRVSLTFRVLATAQSLPRIMPHVESSSSDHKGPSTEAPDQIGTKFEMDGVTISCRKLRVYPKCKVIKNSGGGDCFWLALEHFTGVTMRDMKQAIKQNMCDGNSERLEAQMGPQVYAEDEAICAACKQFGFDIVVYDHMQGGVITYSSVDNSKCALMKLAGSHFEALVPIKTCTIKALAECLKRREIDILTLVAKAMGHEFLESLLAGTGLTIDQFSCMATLLGINSVVEMNGEVFRFNVEGNICGLFRFENGHATFVQKRPTAAHVHTNVAVHSLEITDRELLPITSISSKVEYTPDISRAQLLSDSLNQGTTGVLCSELFNEQGVLMPADPTRIKRRINVVLGVFGCGKSHSIRQVLANSPGRAIIYVSPRKFLNTQYESYLTSLKEAKGGEHVKNFKSFTFEKALLKSSTFLPGALVVFDEVQLFPPGFIDLCFCIMAENIHVLLLGDPCQSDYDSEKDRNILSALGSDISNILKDQTYNYNIVSQRFLRDCFQGRLPCKFGVELKKGEQLQLIEGLDSIDASKSYAKVCLVSSFEEKKIASAYLGAKCKIYTFGESTGANFDEGCILITSVAIFTSEKRWITALSRFRIKVALINVSSTSWDILCKQYGGRSLGHFLSKTAKPEHLQNILPGKPLFTEGFLIERFGSDEGKREEKLQGDPWLKTMVDLLQVEDQEDIEEAKVILHDEWFKVHLPQCEMEGVRARWVHKIMAKEFREKRMGFLVSEQFTDEHSKQKGKELTNAAERFESIYPRHRAADTVTFIMAVRKRLRFSDPIKEAAKLNQAMPFGPFLLKEFLARVPLKPMHDARMMAEAKFDFEEKKTSKSAATIENHSNRSMREWAIDIGLVFSKSQLCTKFDNRFRDAKAAQTIVCFQHAVLCRFAPFMRYIEKKLNEVLPEKYYIHSGKGLEELNAWVIRGEFKDTCTESDYEAFDASQDQYIVAFEVHLMKFLGLPNDLIEDYKFIKTHLGSKLGSFAIMRFSGEASTFLFNTMANMLFTFLRYDIKGAERICFAGDDMCSNTRLHVSSKHEGFLKKLKLKAKVAHTVNPTFCGWNLCPDGIFKKPQLVFERLCIAKETNNLVNCIDNYAIEVAYAYQMGEKAVARMNEEEVDAFYNCVRVIIKNKHLLKSDVRLIYESGKIQ
uniref:RNA-dependent RNA polymerase n=1 Tax=Kalanchoe latent virus TaxID=132477 RepID=A0A286QI46_9VIRU|nr:RNA-dependent RNA polymerase [Kalanchoe latent virus]